jgi:tRNA threonylcarbamoyladenosine biosynthesis protein TsaE
MRIHSRGEAQTLERGAVLSRRARARMLVCLKGPLGSGKTTFVRGFLRGLGHRGPVRSPAFGLVHEYPRLRPPVYHLDLYRVGQGELGGFGLEEYLADPRAACMVEWPEVARDWLGPDRLDVMFSYAEDGGRDLSFLARGPRSRALLRGLRP